MFEVTDYHELIALNKALFEARYYGASKQSSVPGSPFVATIHERVLAAIFVHEKQPQSRIDEFMKCSKREIEQAAVREFLSGCDWNRMDRESQRGFIANLVRPFVATETELEDLRAFAESQHRG